MPNDLECRERWPRVYFQSSAFTLPAEPPDPYLVSAMMPFSAGLNGVYSAIQEASSQSGMRCERADNIWKESAVIQDIFGLIYRSFMSFATSRAKTPTSFTRPASLTRWGSTSFRSPSRPTTSHLTCATTGSFII
ncbi:hypothetical protein ACWGS9_33220 [Bradyrhizobium sp. Arg314]